MLTMVNLPCMNLAHHEQASIDFKLDMLTESGMVSRCQAKQAQYGLPSLGRLGKAS